ncbi:MAG TPA: HEAT repeat domain-containing protein [Pirellulales bacterium]|nr:HEAT repeat domain-containing protein [Pirellulales bacterium]
MPVRAFVVLVAALSVCLATLYGAESDYPPSLVAPTEPLTPQEQQQRFHLPEGFVIELVASEPEIHKPMNLAFDGRGRLYVTSSLEYPFPAKEGSRDTLHVLADEDGDGRYDRTTLLVGGLNIPIGVTPTDDGAIYYSIPSIYRWTGNVDAPGGQAGELLYGTFGFRDTHGMASSFTRWLDGWVYACHGFANTSQIKGNDEKAFSMQSGNTFRMRADGSHAEQYTHGQVNPFGLCFDPLGNLYSADCHSMPIYQLLRGAYYPSFGKPHDGLGFGPTMIGHNHGSTGIAGVVYYAADHFPAEYRGTVFIGNPVTGRVNHDRLAWHGSSPQAIEQPDFLWCDDPWFRPVDLKLSPDGALYIADFYNCIIGHYEVPLTHPRRDRQRGRIWRVRYQGDQSDLAQDEKAFDLPARSPDELVKLIGHPNLAVRTLATEELVGRKELPPLATLLPEGTDETSGYCRAHGLWIVERRTAGGLPLEVTRRLANDSSPLVRVHLVKALAERSVWPEESGLVDVIREKLSDDDPFVRRAAAEALGRHPEPASVEPLLKLWRETPNEDTHLIHVARMALRDHLLQPGLTSLLTRLSGDADNRARLAEVSLGAHTADAAEFLLTCLDKMPLDDRTPEYVHEVARYASVERSGELCRWLNGTNLDNGLLARDLALAVHRANQERGTVDPEELTAYAKGVARRLLGSDQAAQVQGGAELARELRLSPLLGTLAELAATGSRPAEVRVAAMEACVAIDAPSAVATLSQILSNPTEAILLRQKAAGSLASIQRDEAREALLVPLRTAPDRLAVEIAAGLAQQKEGAEALLAEITAGRASPRLLQERSVEERLRKTPIAELDARLATLTAGLPAADDRIHQLIAARGDGFTKARADADTGRDVFKKHCAACHRVGGQGGKIGPDLDGVGLRGADRLLEDVLDPSRNVDQAFRSTLIQTGDGRSISGLVLREEGAVLVLADSQGKELRLPLADIDDRVLSPLSPMPANVADLVPEGDFYDLLAFLLSQQQKPKEAVQ